MRAIKWGVVLVLAAFIFLSNSPSALAVARSAPFPAGWTIDPGAEVIQPCGPTDANCFPSLSTVAPVGTGAGSTGFVRLMELLCNGIAYVGFKAPDNVTATTTWTLPGADGSAGQVLATDGSGVLSWVTAASNSTSTTNILSTTTNITSYGTTTIGGPVTNLNSTTTNITSGGTTTLTSATTVINSTSTTINSSSTTITGTTTLTNLVLGSLTGFLKSVGGVVSATSTFDLVNNVFGILGIAFGGTGTSTAPQQGQFLVGNAGGTYDFISTSTLGRQMYASTSIGADVAGATATGIFFIDPNTGKLAQDTADFNYDPNTNKLTVTGGIDPLFLQLKDVASGTSAYLEFYNGASSTVSAANTGRMIYSTSTQSYYVSMNGGAYTPIVVNYASSTLSNLTVTATSTFATTSATALSVSNGITLSSFTPGNIANALYNVAGTLYFNGTALGAASAGADWAFFNGSGVKLATSTNQVLVGASATSTTASLEVQGNTYFGGTSTVGNIVASSTALGSSTVTATSTTNGLAAFFANIVTAVINTLTATTASIANLTGYNATLGTLVATSSADLASTTLQGNTIAGSLTATSSITTPIITATNAQVTNGTTTNASSTNLYATNA